jgi:protocatechuate 3,4-dioxygenase alpha subunit
MVQSFNRLKESASQTAGPYVHIGLTPNFAEIAGVYPDDLGTKMAGPNAKGERITIVGRVIDGAGAPLRDALVEIWQADAAGLYNSPAEMRGSADADFTGWGRCPTDMDTGEFRFETVKPGKVPAKDGRPMAPHISFWVVARGINLGLNTRMYFADEAEANAADPILARIEHKSRIPTLMAKRDGDVYRFDIHLQGADETIFFDI